jgi:hypothetical protein
MVKLAPPPVGATVISAVPDRKGVISNVAPTTTALTTVGAELVTK